MKVGDLVKYKDETLEFGWDDGFAIIIGMEGEYDHFGFPIEVHVLWIESGDLSTESSNDLEVI